jgi:hypothetical protein
MAAPLCRYCAKPISKQTETYFFGCGQGEIDRNVHHGRGFTAQPATKAEAQTFVNGRIVSVRRWGDRISQVSTWDGESYVSPYFCNGDHARRFAYAVARDTGLAMPDYHEAMKARAG